jgi:hypothetical protein
MPAKTAARRTAAARLAALERHHPKDVKTKTARDVVASLSLEEYVKRLVDDAPPLTQATRDRLSILLRASQ